MRELEFLPPWYPMLARQRRFTAIYAAIALGTAVWLGTWTAVIVHRVGVGEKDLARQNARIARTQDQITRLAELENLRAQMLQQAREVRRLGPYVPASRLIDALGDMIPADVALLDLAFDTQSAPRVEAILASAVSGPDMDRRMNVRIHGVAPSDDEIGKFLTGLSTVPYFGQIAMGYSRDRVDHGKAMREFEINFTIGLNESEFRKPQ